MMSLSEDTQNGELAINGAHVTSTPTNEEKHNTLDVKPNKVDNEHRAPPAWLDKETKQGSSKLRLPPVTAQANKKRRRHTNSRDKSKVKLNAAIRPVQEEEEVPRSNVDA